MSKNHAYGLLENNLDAANISPKNVNSFYQRFVGGITGGGS